MGKKDDEEKSKKKIKIKNRQNVRN